MARSSQNFRRLFIRGVEIHPPDTNYAGMYFNDNSTAQVIETADTPICLRHTVQGGLEDFDYVQGSTGSITAYADAGGGEVTVTSAGHNLETGDIISIRGSTNYNGIFEITKVDADNFKITDTWASDDGASDWDSPDYLQAGLYAEGQYVCLWFLSLTETAPAGSVARCVLYKGTTELSNTATKHKFSTNDVGEVSGGGIVQLSSGDRVFITLESTGTNEFTVGNGNILIKRL